MELESIPNFIVFLEQQNTSICQHKIKILIMDYLSLDLTHCETIIIRDTIDTVFRCIFDKSLSELINIYTNEPNAYVSKINRLENEILELKTTIEELRESYWNLKHPNINGS